MPEPIANSLVLFGIWLEPRRGFWAGVAWGVAAMARVEASLFGAGLVIAHLVGRRRSWWLVAGFVVTMGLYLKFMWDQTGNPIYPFYWSFLFVGFGAFNSAPVVTTATQSLGPIPGVATLASAAGVILSLWKGPPSYMLLVYGFGYSVFSFATFMIVDAWKERGFELPMDFAAILCAVALFKILPRRMPSVRFAAIGAVYDESAYRGGVIAVPGDEPTLTYAMVRLLLVPPASPFNHSVPDYMAFMADHPDWFDDTGANLSDGLKLDGVHTPAIDAATCRTAQSAAP